MWFAFVGKRVPRARRRARACRRRTPAPVEDQQHLVVAEAVGDLDHVVAAPVAVVHEVAGVGHLPAAVGVERRLLSFARKSAVADSLDRGQTAVSTSVFS